MLACHHATDPEFAARAVHCAGQLKEFERAIDASCRAHSPCHTGGVLGCEVESEAMTRQGECDRAAKDTPRTRPSGEERFT